MLRKILISLVAWSSLGNAVTLAQTPCEGIKLVPADGGAFDQFGRAVSIDGDIAIIGAPLNDEAGEDAGAAYVFQRGKDPANWVEVTKLTAAAAPTIAFGRSCDLDGNTAVVGASPGAYVFQRDHGGLDNWGQVVELTTSPSVPGDLFGSSVSISGDIALIGAAGDTSLTGAAYIFRRDQGGPGQWGQVAMLRAGDPAPTEYFGGTVSVDGDTAIVGAHHDGIAGAAYIFERTAPDTWVQVKKLSGAVDSDEFGRGVSVDLDTAIVGAHFSDDHGSGSGSAYIFKRDMGGPDNWGELVKLTASDAGGGDTFGYAVSIAGQNAIVGAHRNNDDGGLSGKAYLFRRDEGGSETWGQSFILDAFDNGPGDVFGFSVSGDGTTVLVGAQGAAARAGAAYVFLFLGSGTDCNANQIADECDLTFLTSLDCNGNLVPDECDIASAVSADVNANGIPDDCECLADINGSGAVNVIDLIRVLVCFGLPASPDCVAEDVNFDGTINVLDLIDLLLAFGTACP